MALAKCFGRKDCSLYRFTRESLVDMNPRCDSHVCFAQLVPLYVMNSIIYGRTPLCFEAARLFSHLQISTVIGVETSLVLR